jgi:hypothetical protein
MAQRALFALPKSALSPERLSLLREGGRVLPPGGGREGGRERERERKREEEEGSRMIKILS